MRYSRGITVSVLIVFLAAVFMAFGGCAKKPAPKPLPGTPGSMFSHPRIVVGYYENPWPGTSDVTGSFPSMKANYKSISAVGPFWYRATKDGTLEAKDSQVVYNTARNLGLKVYPLVTNKSGATDDILGDPTTRSKVIDNIVKLVQEKKYDGINIDFELLPPKHRDNLTAFMAELYPKMKAINKTLIISVFPQVDVAKDVSGAYNYPELAKSADYLQIMTYDHHYSNSPPGPIAAIDWYEKNVKYAIDQCGAQKILVGVGVYGYDWPPSGDAETVTYADAITRAKKAGVKILYDDNNQAPHFKYNDHEVWFEDDKSVGAKLDVVAKYNPAGIAIWRLGQEQPEVWKVINEKFPK